LKKDHLNEIKAFNNPAIVIRVVLGGVVILLQDKIKAVGGQIVIKTVDGKKEEDYFETAKKYLLNDVTTLMKDLVEYKKENINPAFIKKLNEKIMGDPEFTLDRAKSSSYAIQFLFLWVKAMFDFNKVFNETRPLREKLEGTQKMLAEKTAFLKTKMDALDAVNKKIQEL
jgi:dynein heavy chain